jgi:nitroreductase
MMSFKDLVKANRSYRRFFEEHTISEETLLTFVDYARITPSGTNKQALRYYIACEKELNGQIFETLVWAAYLSDWQGPIEGERPAAYVVLIQDKEYTMATAADAGIAAQTILLGATELGLGGCTFGNIDRDKLKKILKLADNFEILLVIALGRPKETVVIVEIEPADDIKYWRDENQIHHVPKRKLKDIILSPI